MLKPISFNLKNLISRNKGLSCTSRDWRMKVLSKTPMPHNMPWSRKNLPNPDNLAAELKFWATIGHCKSNYRDKENISFKLYSLKWQLVLLCFAWTVPKIELKATHCPAASADAHSPIPCYPSRALLLSALHESFGAWPQKQKATGSLNQREEGLPILKFH